MKNRHTPILVALGLAVGYSALLAAAIGLRGIEPGAPTIAARSFETTPAVPAVEAAPARAATASLRLRMTLPFVPAGQVRAESSQEI